MHVCFLGHHLKFTSYKLQPKQSETTSVVYLELSFRTMALPFSTNVIVSKSITSRL